jgi:UDP-2-acetamido-3-amino-2,3-dideoxy-glucuronate N-acetyltransferase
MSNHFVHPAALVETDQIGQGTRVWAFAHVMAGAKVGCHCNVGDHAFIEAGAVVGDNVTIKNNVCVWAGITLGNDVFVGPNVAFTNDRFPRSPRMPEVKARYEAAERWLLPTAVEVGVSIGANATILPGLRLGKYCMIGAGSVVTSDIQPFALVIGSPARRVADICRCGQKLEGPYYEATCENCGETPATRLNAPVLEPTVP